VNRQVSGILDGGLGFLLQFGVFLAAHNAPVLVFGLRLLGGAEDGVARLVVAVVVLRVVSERTDAVLVGAFVEGLNYNGERWKDNLGYHWKVITLPCRSRCTFCTRVVIAFSLNLKLKGTCH
jgi:hypothetical protein